MPGEKTAEYFERAAEFGNVGADGSKTFPTLNSHEDEAHWLMWMAYYILVDMKASVFEMAKRWKTGQTWTVPTMDPYDYDPSVLVLEAHTREVRHRLDGPPLSDEQRDATVKRILAQMRRDRAEREFETQPAGESEEV